MHDTNNSEYLHLCALPLWRQLTMAGRIFPPPGPKSLFSDEYVGLPPFGLFQGTVHEQIQQAIAWRQQELVKSQASSSSSSLDASSATVSPVDISSPFQTPSPSCSIQLTADTVPQLPGAAQPTTPHHHERHDPLINLSTPCQPHELASFVPIVAPQGAKPQPTACPLPAGDNRGLESNVGDLRFSEPQDRQRSSCTISPTCNPAIHQHDTRQKMTESVKVKEDSTFYYSAYTALAMC